MDSSFTVCALVTRPSRSCCSSTASPRSHHHTHTPSHCHTLTYLLQFWFSWRHQLRAFSKDYYVVAVDMRFVYNTHTDTHTHTHTHTHTSTHCFPVDMAVLYTFCIHSNGLYYSTTRWVTILHIVKITLRFERQFV